MKHLILSILTRDTKRADLLKALQDKGYKITDSGMRKIVSEIPEIGSSCYRGYFIIRTEKDLSDAMTELKSKATALFKRADTRYKRFGKELQPEMLFREV